MTTTIRPDYDTARRVYDFEFTDCPLPTYLCHECGTQVGDTDDCWEDYWIDPAAGDTAVWCGYCIDPEEERS